VKVPGTNKRTPRQRDASEVITQDRPDLRLIDPQLWQDTQARLKSIHARYTNRGTTRGAMRHRNTYLFSGILICDACSGPMTIVGGSSCRYYACATNRTKGTCENRRAIKEPIARTRILDAIRERLTSPDGVAHVRKLVATALRDYSRTLEADVNDRRERIKRTEEKIRGLFDFVAQGDRSQYVTSTLRDLETYVLAENATVAQLVAQAEQPLRLPDEVTAMAFELDQRLMHDPQAGREQLIRWLRDGSFRVTFGADGKHYAICCRS
jgi:site-specific DNA recombinase